MTATEALRLVRQRHEATEGPPSDVCDVCKALDVIGAAIEARRLCERCKGSGKVYTMLKGRWQDAQCKACNGSGRV